MKLSIGFSPCPNDTFIFDALVHGKIDTKGLEFEVYMSDVEDLNQKAFNGELEITKLSYHAFTYLTEKYALCNSGSALGNNVGPLLICRHDKNLAVIKERLEKGDPEIRIAIPGKYTTANFLLSLVFPNAKNKTELVFSEIENAVLSGEADAGLIIHENRFTYADRGLQKIIDCGEYWQSLVKAPIPLGGIVVKRNLPDEIKKTVSELIAESVRFAFNNPSSSIKFVRENAQEMSEMVMQKHIDLYVNHFSIDLGKEGRLAVETMFGKAVEKGIIKEYHKEIYV